MLSKRYKNSKLRIRIMPSREDYLKFLEDFNMTEAEVLPMLDINKLVNTLPGDEMAEFLITLINAHKNMSLLESDEREALNTMTEYMAERTNTNELICKLNETLLKEFSDSGINIESKFYPGVFPSSSFNAQCVKKENGYLILLDTGCFEMIESAISIFLSLWDKQEKISVFSEIVEEYSDKRSLPDLSLKRPPGFSGDGSFPRLKLSYAMTTSAEEFVIAHEYGHLANNHLLDANLRYLTEDKNSPKVLSKSIQHEFEADIWAVFKLIKRAQYKSVDKDQLEITCCGPIITLGTAFLIEEYMNKKGIISDTHPPAKDRLYLTIKAYEILGLCEDDFIGDAFLGLISSCSVKMYGKSLDIPLLDRNLNKILENSLNITKCEYQRPEWFDFH
jgi:hypothetical protein